MARLQILTQFKETFENVKTLLDNYNNNLRNELFEIDLNEDNQQLYERGETIYDQCEDDLNNLKEVLEKERLQLSPTFPEGIWKLLFAVAI